MSLPTINTLLGNEETLIRRQEGSDFVIFFKTVIKSSDRITLTSSVPSDYFNHVDTVKDMTAKDPTPDNLERFRIRLNNAKGSLETFKVVIDKNTDTESDSWSHDSLTSIFSD